MLRNELVERVGQLENWQWEMAHYVYQEHRHIKDVGGKDQLADIIKQGWNWDSPIRKMYKEVDGPVIIKSTQDDMFSTWDVTHDGYCINDRAKSMSSVKAAVQLKLQEDYPELYQALDYFSLDTDYSYSDKPDIFPINSRIAVFYVKGGSEGYYIHVEAMNDGKFSTLILGKTLYEGEHGIEIAEKTANAISRIMQV